MSFIILQSAVAMIKRLSCQLLIAVFKQVEDFVYYGKNVKESETEKNVRIRVGLACDAARRLQSIWRSRAVNE